MNQYNEMLKRMQERETRAINQEILATIIGGLIVMGSLATVIFLMMVL